MTRTFGGTKKLECKGSSDCTFKLMQELQGVSKSLDRDELERLMFSHKILIAGRERFGIDRLGRLRLADDLLALCQSACQLAAGNPDLLRYLRPYFDVVFLEKKQLEPKLRKELIEVAWLASRGVPYVNRPPLRCPGRRGRQVAQAVSRSAQGELSLARIAPRPSRARPAASLPSRGSRARCRNLDPLWIYRFSNCSARGLPRNPPMLACA